MASKTQNGSPINVKKWEGKARSEVLSGGAEQVWSILVDDFFGLNKWFPTLATCIPVHGVSGQPGCIRYCAGYTTPVDHNIDTDDHDHDHHHHRRTNWTKQKLLSVDGEHMTYAYGIVDGNSGFKSYVSTLKVAAKEGGGCLIEWRYEVEPVEGWRLEDLDLFIGSGLQVMVQRMEEALCNMNTVTKITK